MKTRRFLVDENITPALADQLRRLQPEMEVMKIGDKKTLPQGTSDPEILKWLESEGFSLITENRKINASAFDKSPAQRRSCSGNIYNPPESVYEGCD